MQKFYDDISGYIEMHNGKRRIRIHQMVHLGPESYYNRKRRFFLRERMQGFQHYTEGMKNMPKGKGPNRAYQGVADLLGVMVQPMDWGFPTLRVDVDYNEVNAWEKFQYRLMSKVIRMSMKLISKASPEKVWENMEQVLRDAVESDEPKKSLFNAKIISENRERLVVEAVLASNEDCSLVWGGAHKHAFMKAFETAGFVLAD